MSYEEYINDRMSEEMKRSDEDNTLEEKVEIYERALDEIEEVILDSETYNLKTKVQLCKAILEDMKREL